MRALFPISMLALAACLPDVDTDESRIDVPRILAVRAEPAELAPGKELALSALVASADGEVRDAPLDWAFCIARRPLAELGPVNRNCELPAGDDIIVPVGIGPSVHAVLPRDGCRLFGPDVPPPMDGEPPGRPADPDLTGGYYQPIRILGLSEGSAATIFEERIQCGIAGATPDDARTYRMSYRANAHPLIDIAELEEPGLALSDGARRFSVQAGASTVVRVAWTETETYLVYDPIARALAMRRESMRVAWYATAGSFEHARTGRAGDDPATNSANRWTAPDTEGEVHMWIVVRDERGGVAWESLTVDVTP